MDSAPAIAIEIGSAGNEWITGAVGVFGAVLGSLVAVVGTEVAARRNRKREHRARNAALSFAIYQKISFIYSDALTIRRTLRTGIFQHALEEVRKSKLGIERSEDGKILVRHNAVSSYIVGWANPPNPISFAVEETWVAKDVSGVDLLNAMMNLDRTFNALLSSVERYSNERRDLQSQIRVDDVAGVVVTMAGPPEDFLKYHAQSNSLDQMILDMHDMSEKLVVDAFAALRLLVESPLRPFGSGQFETVTPDGEKITLQALQPATLVDRIRAATYR